VKLSQLLQDLSEKEFLGDPDVEISSLCYDSRKAGPGALFAAVPGFHVDGHRFVTDAVRRGAVAVVAERGRVGSLGDLPEPRPALVLVDNARRALAKLACAFYGYPARKLRVIGVTGTDGKTTTTYLINAILEEAGYRAGLLGTVEFKVGGGRWNNDTRQTTPESPDIQALLAQMVREKVDYAIIESTSHALVLDRVTGCEYDVGVFTNLTSDHLDFHGSREQYLRDKMRLFEMLGDSWDKGIPKVGVLNADDPAYSVLAAVSPGPVISYGLENPASVTARDLRLRPDGSSFTAVTPEGELEVELPLAARFNVYNALAAIGVGLSQGIALPAIGRALASVTGVPGRMERIDEGQPFTVMVDYAHTPDSLQKVLETLRPLAKGRIIVVFGCAGERDRARRSGMGRVAGELADFAVLTNEDPRSEDPRLILQEIEAGMASSGRDVSACIKIVDRREAIAYAFKMALPEDVVLLTGKGHEGCIIIGTERVPWDDRRVAREVLRELKS